MSLGVLQSGRTDSGWPLHASIDCAATVDNAGHAFEDRLRVGGRFPSGCRFDAAL